MIGSDLLFEYNKATLRENARLSLMKVAMLVEMNPAMYCWLEGHTDLYGDEAFNYDLSRRRAKAVKDYLVKAFDLSPDRFHIMPYGKTRPIVREGTKDEQAVNRRVEIKMRKTKPKPLARPKPPKLEPPKPEAEKPGPSKALPVEGEGDGG